MSGQARSKRHLLRQNSDGGETPRALARSTRNSPICEPDPKQPTIETAPCGPRCSSMVASSPRPFCPKTHFWRRLACPFWEPVPGECESGAAPDFWRRRACRRVNDAGTGEGGASRPACPLAGRAGTLFPFLAAPTRIAGTHGEYTPSAVEATRTTSQTGTDRHSPRNAGARPT